MNRIPVAGPWITQREISYVTDAVTNAWYANANMYHDRFESAFSTYIGSKYSILLPSCTSAIHLALLALGIGSGDEVIVPESTWIASAAPVTYVGAMPVFADVDSQTWCLTAESFKSRITARTKAVIPVDLYGNMPDMDSIREIAKQHNIAVIEDAAEALGSTYRGHNAGNLGDVGVFSFHGSKTLTTGEGGMLVTSHDEIRSRVLTLRDHGRRPGDKMFYNAEVGQKYKMSSLQAALGLAQLERIDELVERKRQIYAWYCEGLDGIDGLTMNYETPETTNSFWMTTIILDADLAITKEEMIGELDEQGIDSRPFFYPLSALPAFHKHPQSNSASEENPVAYQLGKYGVNLPSAASLSKDDIMYVCDCITAIITKK